MVRNITSRVLAYLLLLIVLVVATCYFLSEEEYIPGDCHVNTCRGVLLPCRVERPVREPEIGLLLSSLGER